MPQFFSVSKKIYLADTDVTGIAYYAKHLEWMEMARVELIAKIYKPLSRLIVEDKFSFIPISVHIDYKAPALFEDLLKIKVRVKEVQKIKLILAYEMTKEVEGDEVLVSEAEITMLCINVEKENRPAKIPDHLLKIFESWEERI